MSTPRRGRGRQYEKVTEFASPEEALEFVKNEATWSIQKKSHSEDGTKVWYRCNKVKWRGKQKCPAHLCLLYHSDRENVVSVFRTTEGHYHQGLQPCRGLPMATRRAIIALYERGMKAPKRIIPALVARGFEAPSLRQVQNFAQLHRMRRKNSAPIDHSQFDEWLTPPPPPSEFQPDNETGDAIENLLEHDSMATTDQSNYIRPIVGATSAPMERSETAPCRVYRLVLPGGTVSNRLRNDTSLDGPSQSVAVKHPTDVMGMFVVDELKSLEPSSRDWMKRVIADIFYHVKESERSETTEDLDWLMKIFTDLFYQLKQAKQKEKTNRMKKIVEIALRDVALENL